jgi:DNA polymerase IV
VLLARLAQGVEKDLGITLSVGLSHNKFLAKIASDLDKPRGFSVIGQAETEGFLADKPVRFLWGVGLATQAALEGAGIRRLADLRAWDKADLVARFGSTGARLWHLARGQDDRRVSPHDQPKSISKETTFDTDLSDADLLAGHLWRLAEQVSSRAKARGLQGRTVTVKLKQADHRILTRRRALAEPAQLADAIWRAAEPLLAGMLAQAPFRLIGVGLSALSPASGQDPAGDLLDPGAARRAAAERAADRIRARFGIEAIIKGRALR